MLLSVITFTLLSSMGLSRIESKFGPEVWYKESDPLLKNYHYFEKEFGKDETIIISLYNKKGIFNKATIEKIEAITDDLSLTDKVESVSSITNFNWIRSIEDEIIIAPMFDNEEQERSEAFIQEKADILMGHEEVINSLVSKDRTLTFIIGYLQPRLGTNINFKKILKSTDAISEKYSDEDNEIKVTGTVHLNHTVKETSSNDLKTIMPILLGIIVLLMYFIFRSIKIVLVAFLILVSTNVVTFGIASLLGFKFTNLTFTIPIILLGICIADTVHLLSTIYSSKNPDYVEAIRESYFKNFKPTILTTLTTTIGFVSLSTSNSVPIIEMGLVSGFGVIIAWLFSYSIIAPCLLLFPIGNFKRTEIKTEKYWMKLASFIESHRKVILIFFACFLTLSIYLSTKVTVDFNPYEQFSEDSQIRRDNNFITSKLGGYSGPEMVIDSGKEGGAISPDFMKKVESFSEWMKDFNEVNNVSSILSTLKQTNKVFHASKDSEYIIPKTRRHAAEYLFVLEMDPVQGEQIRSKLSKDRRFLRLTVLWTVFNSKRGLELVDVFEKKAKELGLKIEFTGKSALSIKMLDYIFNTFITSILFSIVIITITIVIGLKSIKLGLLSIIPNVVPLLLSSTWIYLNGLNIDFSSVIVFTISLGIAVDDTIHFLVAYKENDGKYSFKEMLEKIFQKAGNGIVITTLLLVVGFYSLTLSDYIINYKLGFLTSLVLFAALVCDLLLLPAFLAFITKLSINKE